VYGHIAQVVVELSCLRKDAQFVRCIHGIRNKLTKKDLVIGIQELFNDGENVLGLNVDLAFLHTDIFLNCGAAQSKDMPAGKTCHFDNLM
jgi:hypothetical protein